MNQNFRCPYCNQPTTITSPNKYTNWTKFNIEDSKLGDVGLGILAITCPNNECKKLFLKVTLNKAISGVNWYEGKIIQEWQLLPESYAKVLPKYFPDPIAQDYYQACRIRDLSAKASSTMSRRCLQGMIRDFWGIKKATLKLEIDDLEEKVDSLTWGAIDSVRKVGNIGAHMEKDINLIIDVDTKEAQLLIELIEQLVDDWYVERFNKEQRLSKIKLIAEKKDREKLSQKSKGK